MQAQSAFQAGSPRTSAAIRYGRPIGRFALSFAEMCAAMCMGGIVLDLAFFQGAALIGYPNFFEQNYVVSVLILGVNWAIAMGVYMTIRGHPLRHNLEMSSTAVIAALLLIGAYWWFGFTSKTSIPGWPGQALFQCGPSCVLMGAYMLFRYKHYTASAEHQAHRMA